MGEWVVSCQGSAVQGDIPLSKLESLARPTFEVDDCLLFGHVTMCLDDFGAALSACLHSSTLKALSKNKKYYNVLVY